MKLNQNRIYKDFKEIWIVFLRQSRFAKRVEAIGLIFLIQLLVTFFIGAVSIHFFLELAEAVVEENSVLLRADHYILDRFNPYYFPDLLGPMKLITFLGSWLFIVILAGLLVLFFLLKPAKRLYIFHVLLIALGTMGFNRLLKNIFDRERPGGPYPVEVISTSYPSGHAMLGFAFYGLLIYFTWIFVRHRPLKTGLIVVFTLLVFAIGLSRVYLGVHYPSDVVAGFAAGAFWLSLSLVTARAAERLFLQNPNNRPKPVSGGRPPEK